MSRAKKTVAGAGEFLAASCLASLTLLACRPSKTLAPAPGPPPQDRHAPYNFVARNGMVVAAHPLAAEAGLSMLRAGGNAVDAAVATAFALNAVEPFASGMGGGGFMVIYLAREKKSAVINYREKAPRAASPRMFKEKGEEEAEWRASSGLAVAVPGALAGWDLALRRYGTRSLAEAGARAIQLAEQGFEVSQTFSDINKEEFEKLVKNAAEGNCYLNEGLPYEPGDRFRNPDLAETLRLIAAEGIDVFYRGKLAPKIVAAVQARDGIITLEDLASYKPQEVVPLKGIYKDWTILTVPPPASGGLHFVQLLNICENWPVKTWGPNSVAYIHHLSEALRLIFADRERYLGDPDFVPIPVQGLLAKDYASRLAAQIQPDRLLGSYPHGEFVEKDTDAGNTTHLCVIDREGNVVSLTQSINDFFGTGIVPDGTGFLLNNHMDDFSSNPLSSNAAASERRPVSSMGPMIIFKNGSPYLILGSPGGTRIFSSLAQILLNVTEFGLALDEAIEAPRFFSYSVGGQARPIAVESRFDDVTIQGLKALGHEVMVREAYDKYFGGAQGIMFLKGKGIILGGADSRRDGWGAGY